MGLASSPSARFAVHRLTNQVGAVVAQEVRDVVNGAVEAGHVDGAGLREQASGPVPVLHAHPYTAALGGFGGLAICQLLIGCHDLRLHQVEQPSGGQRADQVGDLGVHPSHLLGRGLGGGVRDLAPHPRLEPAFGQGGPHDGMPLRQIHGVLHQAPGRQGLDLQLHRELGGRELLDEQPRRSQLDGPNGLRATAAGSARCASAQSRAICRRSNPSRRITIRLSAARASTTTASGWCRATYWILTRTNDRIKRQCFS